VRILIAGVSGTLGSYLAKQLIGSGHEVAGISRIDPGISGLEFISHDLTKPIKVHDLKESIVINSAAVTRDGFSHQILSTNLAIATNCLAISSGPQILVSSSSVYDLRKPSVQVTTDQATGRHPFLNSYSKSKFESEQLYAKTECEAIILRPHALIGPDDQTLLPRVKGAIKNGSLRLPNAGRAMHEFTSLKNFCQAIDLSISKFESGWSGNITLNISDGKATSIADAIKHALLPDSINITSVPLPIAMTAGLFGELLALGGREPKLSRYSISQLAYDRSYDISETRSFLGYAPEANTAF
jgi:nucleoside-diphosphate-sugar epimerase